MKKLVLILFLFLFVVPDKAYATAAQLACSPSTSTVTVGSTITTDLILNTREYEVTGANAILTYTTGVLDANTASLVPITSVTNWTAPTKKLVDSTLGKIELDYGQSQTAFTESGTIGKVTFTAKQAGTANVSFVFFSEYDDTTTGVAKVWGEKTAGVTSNILTDVVNCIYTVTGGTNPTATPAPGVPTSPPLPRTGNGGITGMIVGIGGVLSLIGFFLPKILFKRV